MSCVHKAGTRTGYELDFGSGAAHEAFKDSIKHGYDGLDGHYGLINANYGQAFGSAMNALACGKFSQRSDSTGTWNPLADGLGSSLSLTDASGAVQTVYTYGAFGQTANTGTASGNSSQYTSRENDGIGLQFNRARYYSSILQRFISEDPLRFGGGDINLYSYVRNNPVNFVDPLAIRSYAILEG